MMEEESRTLVYINIRYIGQIGDFRIRLQYNKINRKTLLDPTIKKNPDTAQESGLFDITFNTSS